MVGGGAADEPGDGSAAGEALAIASASSSRNSAVRASDSANSGGGASGVASTASEQVRWASGAEKCPSGSNSGGGASVGGASVGGGRPYGSEGRTDCPPLVGDEEDSTKGRGGVAPGASAHDQRSAGLTQARSRSH